MMLDDRAVREVVKRALEEDIGSGDVTVLGAVPEDRCADGEIIAKEKGVLAGLTVANEVYRQIDDRIDVFMKVQDGYDVEAGTVLISVTGPARGLLTAERTALNFLQRLSGIATLTRAYAKEIEGTGAILLDTRKTTPGLRPLEKYAVTVGGGCNHRMGLYDMFLIKDTHRRVMGHIGEAIATCRKMRPDLRLEVEVRNMLELREAVAAGADRIMLDNMGLDDMKEAVAVIRDASQTERPIQIEASGGIRLENIREVAQTGVDFISVGALTHSARALDIAFYIK
jgi:nicotinate-nucleotide pyrophosphorylase (carboxylating)